MNIKIELLDRGCKPEVMIDDSVGFDLKSNETMTIKPRETRLVKTGIKMSIPHGYEAQVRPRSGMAMKKGITVLNSPGTIDPGFLGEVGVILHNTSDKDFKVIKYDRIAQMVFNKVEIPDIEYVEDLGKTKRGEDGFGSTGT